jgi:Na+-driven multidrug efflux pump
METTKNILETERIGKLLPKFALPSVVSGLVGASYNVVDQIFIGHSVGMLGNAATNVAFPLVIACTAVSIMSGVGCAAGFNLASGRGDREKAGRIVGNSLVLMGVAGLLLAAMALVFPTSLLLLFGSTASVMPYARTYLLITAWGCPLSILGAGGSVAIRSDGSPGYALFSVLSGALLNVALDAIFLFVFHWGMAGAAYATVIGQALSAALVLSYFARFRTLRLRRAHFQPRAACFKEVAALGMGPFVNNISMFFVQILLNKALTRYGAGSRYGAEIPLACAGVITKLNSIFAAIVIGIAQGVQPIISFNYGARNYARVKEAAAKAILAMLSISFAVFLCCQLLPRQLVAIFGSGTEAYFQFAERYLRVFMMLVCVNGMQVTAGNIFTSIGKARLSVFISLTRQLLFLPPLILLLPRFYGIDGLMYAGPVADGMCVIVAALLLAGESRRLDAEAAGLAPPAGGAARLSGPSGVIAGDSPKGRGR